MFFGCIMFWGEFWYIICADRLCLWGVMAKRPSDRNRSLWFFLTFFFSFDLFGLKLGQYVLSGLENVNQQKFFGSGYSGDIPGPGFVIISRNFLFCVEMSF